MAFKKERKIKQNAITISSLLLPVVVLTLTGLLLVVLN